MRHWTILMLLSFGCGESNVDDTATDDSALEDTGSAETDTEDTEIDTGPADPDARHLLLRDEGNSQLHYVDLAEPKNNWHVDVPAGRDMQLVGLGRVMIGTENSGYEERDIATGEKVSELTGFSGAIAAYRLENHNTLLVEVNRQGLKGIVLLEVDESGDTVRTINYEEYTYARLVRPTPQGTFLVTSDTHILELDEDGQLVWEATTTGDTGSHAWMAVRLDSKETVASGGYAASLQLFDDNGDLLKTITGGSDDVNPFFYAGFQVLSTGNFVVSNWQNHGTGHGESGIQVLEYDPEGNLVWSWKQDPSFVSSLQAVLVLDGLDLEKLHIEGETGALEPVD